MFNKIVLAGGSGYLGKVLCEFYKDKAREIVVLSRTNTLSKGRIHFQFWDGKTKGDWVKCLQNCDLLINLCGKNVNCRYTVKNQKEILRSRLEPTALLGKVIAELEQPPNMWINFASATIYRHAEDQFQDEERGEAGHGFSVDVCRAWEKTFWEASTPRTKKLLLRVGLVMGRKDGIIPRLRRLVLFGMGGKQGNGNQYVSWIHEQDLAKITEWAYLNGRDGEIYNCTSPEAIHNRDLMKLIRETMGIPFGFSMPQWLLEIGAGIIHTETELILKSRWVYPGRLVEKGYRFLHDKPGHAIHEILSCRV